MAAPASSMELIGAQTYTATTERELVRRLSYGMAFYDAVVFELNGGKIVIRRLPHHYYRVTSGDKSERLGGKSSTYALQVLLKRLGIEAE